MSLSFRKYRRGERLTARSVNEIASEQRRASRVTGGNGIVTQSTSAGIQVSAPAKAEFWAKITGGSNPYSWIEQVPTENGGWADGERSGTTSSNQAYESNGNEDIAAGRIVWLVLSIFGDGNRFQL